MCDSKLTTIKRVNYIKSINRLFFYLPILHVLVIVHVMMYEITKIIKKIIKTTYAFISSTTLFFKNHKLSYNYIGTPMHLFCIKYTHERHIVAQIHKHTNDANKVSRCIENYTWYTKIRNSCWVLLCFEWRRVQWLLVFQWKLFQRLRILVMNCES